MIQNSLNLGDRIIPGHVSDLQLVKVAITGVTQGNVMTHIEPGAHIAGDRIRAIDIGGGKFVGAIEPGNEWAFYIMDAVAKIKTAITGGDPTHWRVYLCPSPGDTFASMAALISASQHVMDLLNPASVVAANSTVVLRTNLKAGLTISDALCPPGSAMFVVNGDDGAVYSTGNVDLLLGISAERDF